MAVDNVIKLVDAVVVSASSTSSVFDGLHKYKAFYGIFSATAVPTGGSPTLSVYLQTSPDGGTTWQDIASFQFTGSTAARLFSIQTETAGVATMITPSDGALATNTVVQGPIGDRLRVKYTFTAGGSTGTYTLTVKLVARCDP